MLYNEQMGAGNSFPYRTVDTMFNFGPDRVVLWVLFLFQKKRQHMMWRKKPAGLLE